MSEFSKRHHADIKQNSPGYQKESVMISTDELSLIRSKGKVLKTTRYPKQMLKAIDEFSVESGLAHNEVVLLGLCRLLRIES